MVEQRAARRVAVVGAGISGLSAAWELVAHPARPQVVVLEQATRPGGKLRLGTVGGLQLDVGAEAVLARRPEAVELLGELGLGADVVHPETAAASVFSRGALHPLPAGTVIGVPSDPESVRGLLTPEEVGWLAAEPSRPAPPVRHDVDVASWVASRLGRPVVDRMVEPLLGAVFAGRADQLSLAATAPQLWDCARRGGSLLAALRDAATPGPPPGPVFAGLRGGLGRLPDVLATRLRAAGAQLRCGVTVRELARTVGGWRLTTGPAGAPSVLDVDAVVLATPVTPAARLLGDACPAAAAELAHVASASVAIVTALVPRRLLSGVRGSGFVVPPVEGRQVKAATYCSAKWAWVDGLDPELAVVRMSLGRSGETAVLQRDDDDLAELALCDLGAMIGEPELEDQVRADAVQVTRWGGALPQYAVGHLDRVRRMRAAVTERPGLALCGAYLNGVGVPACIASARQAAGEVLTGAAAR